jgi:hypothetical protein
MHVYRTLCRYATHTLLQTCVDVIQLLLFRYYDGEPILSIHVEPLAVIKLPRTGTRHPLQTTCASNDVPFPGKRVQQYNLKRINKTYKHHRLSIGT